MSKIKLLKLIVILSIAKFNPHVYAGAFEVKTFSAASLGLANAGTSAQTGQIEFMNRNAAVLAGINDFQVTNSLVGIFPVVNFTNQGSTLSTDQTTPIIGNNGGNAGESTAIPSFYIAGSLNENLKVGLALSSLWGLGTSYDSTWIGRYWNVDTKMKTFNINPNIAYKMSNQWHFGAGVQFQYMNVNLSRAVDLGNTIFASTQGASAAFGINPQSQDIGVDIKSDAWGVGANVGLIYQPWVYTQFGFSYRSQINHHLKGNKTFNIPLSTQQILAELGQNPNFAPLTAGLSPNITPGRVKVALSTPDTFLLSGAHNINSEWKILGEITYTTWSKLKEIRIKTTNVSGVSDDVTQLKWKDTLAYNLGFEFKPNALKGWSFRTGIGYDPTPVKLQYRLPGIPDMDRIMISGGVGYQFNSQWDLNLSLAHEITRKNKSILKPTAADPNDFFKGNLVGEYRGHVNIIAARFVYKF